MIPLMVTLLLSLALFAQTPQGGFQNIPSPKAVISGSVVRSTTGEPVVRATITLMRVAGPGSPLAPGGPNAGARGGGLQAPQGQQAQVRRGGEVGFDVQQPSNMTATTDDQGKFQFKDVDAGSYRMFAARNGFSRQEYGQRSVNRPGTVMNIRTGQQITDVAFRLTPAATISGRVLDSNGEPLTGITVQALRSSYDATGKRSLQPAASARTNDLGEYRLYWINPGRYLVNANSARSALDIITSSASQAASQAQSAEQAQSVAQATAIFGPGANPNEVADTGFALTYYPGTTDPSRAVGVDLQPGIEIRAIDFTLVHTQRVKLTGRVIDAETGRPPQNATVSVSPRESSATSSPLDVLIGMDPGNSRYNGATGEFVVANVAPGSYWLQVIAPSANAPPPGPPNATPTTAEALAALSAINAARVPLEVGSTDMDNLSLSVSSGIAIPGQLRIEGGTGNQNVSSFSVSLQSMSGGLSILTILQGGGVRPTADGTFSIPRITPGDYKLVVNGLGTNYYIKDARLNQTEVLQTGMSISMPFNGALDITLGTGPGQVAGVVADATLKPVSGVQAVLIPEQLRNRQDLYKNAVTDQEGRFTLRGVTPGDYRVFAWEDIEPFSYFDPSFLRQYEQQGKLIHVGEGSSQTVDVKLIPATTQ
jgi:Carboxypeptidase regulatory-like domain